MLALARKRFALVAGVALAVSASATVTSAGSSTAFASLLAAIKSSIAKINTLPIVTPPKSIPVLTPPTNKSKVGMNLSQLSTYTGEAPLLNRAKLGAAWSVRGVATNAALLNADGYPIGFPAANTQWESLVPLDPATGTTFDQTYVVRWKGTGSIDVGIVSSVTRSDHKVTFKNVYGCAILNITATNANDPVRDISVVRADQVADYDAGKIFNPTFVDRTVKPFASFRTMDWDATNNSTETSWSDRQKPTDATWTRMPLELEVALANQAGVDLWKNIPAHADDYYVQQAMNYVKANLNPSLSLHLEYSNEVWNGSFEQSQWAAQQAQSMWKIGDLGDEVFYGYRSSQIASIAWSVFGSTSTQLKPVLAGWFSMYGPQVRDAMTLGVSKAKLGSVGTLFREYAVATYFGDALGAGFGNEADRAIVLGWAKDTSSAGMDKAFQQLEHGGLLAQTGTSLDDAKYTIEPAHAAWAKANNLKLVAYEGGLAFYYFLADQKTKPTLFDFYKRLIADPRMGTLYARWIKDFNDNGGTTTMNYADVGQLGEYGPWGCLPDIYAADTPRYKSLRAIVAN